MITLIEAAILRNNARRTVYHGEDFAAAVLRLDKEIRFCSADGTDGCSLPFNAAHIPALLAILGEHGFSAARNAADRNNRIDVSW
jgi:hypothetical protein